MHFKTLGSFDFVSFDTCKSCLLNKMTKSHFTHKGERANDLLGLIHTDVCAPFSNSYFIIFTDNFSRYGFVYLMRHKSKSFETFKEFKSEVQN